MRMNPIVPSAAEVEANQRKWDLERRLEDADLIGVSVSADGGSEKNGVLTGKLPSLNTCMTPLNPYPPSAAEVEANRRKWDLERRLHDAAANSVNVPRKRDLKQKLQDLNPFAINPSVPCTDEVEANRRKWDLERRLQDGDKMDVSLHPICGPGQPSKLSSLNPAASIVHGVMTSRQKQQIESKFCDTDGQLMLTGQWTGSDEEAKNMEVAELSNASVSDRQKQVDFEINDPLIYLLLFSSTAVLHCAIFNFNLELRQFFQLEFYPFGLLLLLSWTFVGFIQFVGGLVGDFVQDRVLLLRRTAVLWGVAVVAFHVAAFQFSSMVSSISLVSGLLCGGVAHGVVCPNVIALTVESKLCSFEIMSAPLSPEEDESSSEEESSAESESSYLSDVSSIVDDELQEGDLASHNFFSGCFAARLAGSLLVQAYYFLLANVDTIPNRDSQTTTASRGFHCMLLMSFGLMASLIYFCFQSWGYRQSDESNVTLSERADERLELKLATLEQGFNASVEAFWTWSWANLVHLCNRAPVGYALLAFVLMALIGAGVSLVVVLLASQTSLPLRMMVFLLIVIGWLFTMVVLSRQLNPTKRQLIREWRRMGLRSRQLYLVIFTVAFICVSGCVSFLRAQSYTTMVVQVCQTRLLVPGTVNTLFEPELLGTAVGTSSLVLLGLSRVLNRCPPSFERTSSELALAKANIFTPRTPTTPVPQKSSFSLYSLPPMVSCPPVTRMCFAMLLYLISVFLSSVVELYRRKAGVSPSLLPRNCGGLHSEFTFLWTLPYVILLGVSDALFRVSLQEACHNLARGCLDSSTSSRRWTGTVQGTISLAESLGYTTALTLVAVLSRWLFQPELTDMALLFLLLTTVVALTHAMLNRIAARALSYQRLYFPVRSSSTN
ncbi:Transmembrane protein [Phytophthora megakarya]|uniref:Transmembrane protein n=1 Tax=Phytophthora megakarya TaxID=4795 RepID=A0A225WYE3_9STRA|nr:Transmembrane protein [Phytophthora megakarya]